VKSSKPLRFVNAVPVVPAKGVLKRQRLPTAMGPRSLSSKLSDPAKAIAPAAALAIENW